MSEPKHGIETYGRNEEQPEDKDRAQDPSSAKLDKEQERDPKGQTEHPGDGRKS